MSECHSDIREIKWVIKAWRLANSKRFGLHWFMYSFGNGSQGSELRFKPYLSDTQWGKCLKELSSFRECRDPNIEIGRFELLYILALAIDIALVLAGHIHMRLIYLGCENEHEFWRLSRVFKAICPSLVLSVRIRILEMDYEWHTTYRIIRLIGNTSNKNQTQVNSSMFPTFWGVFKSLGRIEFLSQVLWDIKSSCGGVQE